MCVCGWAGGWVVVWRGVREPCSQAERRPVQRMPGTGSDSSARGRQTRYVHFIQAEIESNKTIQLVYCQTLKMVADILTKALAYALFAKFASALTGKKFPEKCEVEEMTKRKAEEKFIAKKFAKTQSKKTPKSY